MVIGFPLVLECETTVGDVIQVFEPLEEGDGDTTGVYVEIRNNENVSFNEDLVGCWCCGAVGCLGNDFCLK